MKRTRFVRVVAMFAMLTISGISATVFIAPTSAFAAEASGADIIASGRKYLGTPYEYGASINQTATFDCSSFTKRVFGLNGIELPRSSKQQIEVGTSIPKSQAVAGDLLFFRDSEDPSVPSHVAIYTGNGTMLHATASKGVTFTDIDDSYWSKRYMGTRRVLEVNQVETIKQPTEVQPPKQTTQTRPSTDRYKYHFDRYNSYFNNNYYRFW